MALKEFDFSKLSIIYTKEQDYWKEIKALLKGESFAFRVVYTDGFISSRKVDKIGRVPFGFVINGEIIRLDAPVEAIKLKDSYKILNEKITFSGLLPYCPSYVTLRYIRKNLSKINRFIEEIGGDVFKAGWYASCSEIDKYYASTFKPSCNLQKVFNTSVYAVHMTSPKDIGFSYATPETEVFIRICYLRY